MGLGIDVFGSSPDYDPAADPVVRVSTGEIRKRIAQYYHDSGHEAEIRIDLPLGSYLPEFHFPKERSIVERDVAIVAPVIPERLALRRPVSAKKLGIGIAMTLALVSAIAWRLWARQANVLDQFWAPVLNPVRPRGAVRWPCAVISGHTGDPRTTGQPPAWYRMDRRGHARATYRVDSIEGAAVPSPSRGAGDFQ
jgi:hypothetical protein